VEAMLSAQPRRRRHERAAPPALRRASKHVAFIVHGERAARDDVRHLADWVRRRGHLVELMVTLEKGDGTGLAAKAAHRGVDVVVAAAVTVR